MTEPVRLLAGDATEFERYLLGAATRERPTRLQRMWMRRGIVLAELGIVGTATKALALLTQQVVVVAVVAGSLAGKGSTPVSASPRQLGETAAHSATRVSSSSPSARSASSESAVNQAEMVNEDPSATNDGSTSSKPEVVATPTVGRRRLADLGGEIALMDQARTALRLGAPQSALGTLEQYRIRFPRGSFGQEAQALRIEALAANGSRARAVGLANEFLAHYPNSPHSDRLRRIVAASSPEPR